MKRYNVFVSCFVFLFSLLWSSLTLAQECIIHDDCKLSAVLAKTAFASKPLCFVKKDCLKNTECDDCILNIYWKAPLKSKDIQVCDESLRFEIIPEGSYALINLEYHIDRKGPCNTPVGSHEGYMYIYGPDNLVLASLFMGGTNGLETHTSKGECCKWPHDEGYLRGTIKTTLGDCILRATYSSKLRPPDGVTDVCSSRYWRNWKLTIDGVILCDCPSKPE